MSDPFVPRDQEARRLIESAIDRSLFVEAGAGTGKTTSLVRRLVTLVAGGHATVERIAAITFTDAAAAELRERLRQGLEAEEAGAGDAAVRDYCRRALRDLDRAAVQTLHAFAARLLRERPLDARLPPAFETMDDVAAGLLFESRWDAFADQLLDDPVVAPALRTAFALGLDLDALEQAASALHENHDLVPGATWADPEPPEDTATPALLDALPEVERLRTLAPAGDDRLARRADELLRLASRLAAVTPGTPAALRLLAQAPSLAVDRIGRVRDWPRDEASGENACQRLRALLSGLRQGIEQTLRAARAHALVPLLREIRRFVLAFAEERRRDGRAGFHDLLVWARDLLRDSLIVRDHFRRHYTHLLVDEFQDTDPLQVEIALLLTEALRANGADAERPRGWTAVTPAPGKLFVVGDPKQSIYRFRRAEVSLSRAVASRLGPPPVSLTHNFRSQRPIIDWVNAAFARSMGGSPTQVPYARLDARWDRPEGDALAGGVLRLGGSVPDTPIAEIRAAEAGEISALLGEIRTGAWRVRDERADAGAGAQFATRPSRLADVCILMPSRRTGFAALEPVLEEAGIPYRVESAALVFATQEVRDLIACLRAIDDPTDQIALVAALRSPAFACSDVDVVRFVGEGGRLDYLSGRTGAAATGAVGEAFRVLADFHHRRLFEPPPLLIEAFVRDRRLEASALAHGRFRERWRRYAFLVEQSRAFGAAGGRSLRAFVTWAARQAEEDRQVVELPVPEPDEDAVRVMTIHRAKGLEFPIVVLTGLNASPREQQPPVLFDRESGRVEVRLGRREAPFETPGYEALARREAQEEDDERVRLLYVAATRARDHLVVSLHRRAEDADCLSARLEAALAGRSDLWRAVTPRASYERASPVGAGRPALPSALPDTAEAREAFRASRAARVAAAAAPPAVAASSLGHPPGEAPADGPEAARREARDGTRLGLAVHAVLETIDLGTGAHLARQAARHAAAAGVAERVLEVEALARAALSAPVVQRALVSGRWWREVPVAAPVEGGVVDGVIDLLFEEPDGLVVVDYKTDRVAEVDVEAAAARYRLQAGAYALAVARVTGRVVKEVVLLFLRPAREITLENVPSLVREAEAAAAEVLRGTAAGRSGVVGPRSPAGNEIEA